MHKIMFISDTDTIQEHVNERTKMKKKTFLKLRVSDAVEPKQNDCNYVSLWKKTRRRYIFDKTYFSGFTSTKLSALKMCVSKIDLK